MCNPFAKIQKTIEFIIFSNLQPNVITDDKKYWKSVKPLFSDKITFKEIINLIENLEILGSDTV